MPTAFRQTPGNYFSFCDTGRNLFATFLLTDTAAVLTFTGNMKLAETADNRFANEVNQVGDSLFLLKRQGARFLQSELWNLYTNEKIDSLPNLFDLKKNMGDDYYASFEEFYMSSRNERFVQCYLFMDVIDIGSIKNNSIRIEKHIGMENPPEFHLMQKTGGRYGVKFLSNIMYYESVACGEKYIYALYANTPAGHFMLHPSDHSSLVEVYSREGKPVTVLKLNKSLQSIFVDEEAKCIYGINPEASDDCIYEYKFEIN
jgi:hypothetical protein